jgi:hypothetical protein
MTDLVVDRLRIRGPGAHRLATVASRALPTALGHALADLADGTLGPLSITLDLDPADYDDATLAVLWADRIRAAALAAGARPRSEGAWQGGPPDDAARPGPDVGASPGKTRAGEADDGTGDGLAAAALAWLDAGTPTSTVPLVLAALTDRVTATILAARIGPTAADRLVRALERCATRGTPRRRPGSPPTTPRATATDEAAHRPDVAPGTAERTGSASRVPPKAADDWRTDCADDGEPPADEVAARLTATADALHPHLDLAAADDGAASSADLRRATRVAGVVLLYPWLADLCRDAEALHPLAEPTHARRLALAVLADGPDPEPGLLDDPLVLFLAGAGTPTTPTGATPAPTFAPLDPEPLARATAAVLAGFAALLRGFERLSPSFVRASWLVRPGLLDTDRDPARLLAAPLPLDVILRLLPYPVSLLRLPWTPPLTVRFVL